jgi:hypothetical protein
MRLIFAGFLFVLLVVALCRCTPHQVGTGRTIIATSVRIVRSVDHLVNPGFVAASAAAEEDPERFRRFNVAVTALLMARHALLDAESILDEVASGIERDVGAAIACVVEALQRLFDALPAVGVEMPDAFNQVMSMAAMFAGTCEPADHANVSGVPHLSEVVAP